MNPGGTKPSQAVPAPTDLFPMMPTTNTALVNYFIPEPVPETTEQRQGEPSGNVGENQPKIGNPGSRPHTPASPSESSPTEAKPGFFNPASFTTAGQTWDQNMGYQQQQPQYEQQQPQFQQQQQPQQQLYEQQPQQQQQQQPQYDQQHLQQQQPQQQQLQYGQQQPHYEQQQQKPPPQQADQSLAPPQQNGEKESNLSRSSSLSSLSYEVSQHFSNSVYEQTTNQSSWQQPEPIPSGPAMYNPSQFTGPPSQPATPATRQGYSLTARRKYPTQR